MKKYLAIAGLLSMIAFISLVSIITIQNKKQDEKSSVKVKKAVQKSVTIPNGGWDTPGLEESIKDLPPNEQEMARKSKKSISFYKDRDGKFILVEVDGVKVHADPSDDLNYVGGYTDKPDPKVIGKGVLDK